MAVESVTRRSFVVEVMGSKDRVLLVPDSVDCGLERNIPPREFVPVLLLNLGAAAGLTPLPLIGGHGKEIPFFMRELSVEGRIHSVLFDSLCVVCLMHSAFLIKLSWPTILSPFQDYGHTYFLY